MRRRYCPPALATRVNPGAPAHVHRPAGLAGAGRLPL